MSTERKPLEAYIERVGHRSRPLNDLYAFLLRSSWLRVMELAAALFLTANASFALLYWLVPGSIANTDGSYLDAFFFSVQTFAAIGYGFMYSQGVYGNAIVCLEAFVSLFCVAMLTGIVFAKFARPRARVLFSDNCVIEVRDGVRTLTFRAANERGNDVVEATVSVNALVTTHTREGARMRRFYPLKLERSASPFFMLSWQVFHPIDEESPLHGLTVNQMRAEDVRLVVSLTGLDGTFNQTIYARHLYWAEDILEGHRFVDVMEDLGGGRTRMDFRKFHLVEAQSARHLSPRG
ncbi:MAG: ion channel [Sandaracinaceae bacterium]